jgi:hypothetical protein
MEMLCCQHKCLKEVTDLENVFPWSYGRERERERETERDRESDIQPMTSRSNRDTKEMKNL